MVFLGGLNRHSSSTIPFSPLSRNLLRRGAHNWASFCSRRWAVRPEERQRELSNGEDAVGQCSLTLFCEQKMMSFLDQPMLLPASKLPANVLKTTVFHIRVLACVHACVHACVRKCVRACVYSCVYVFC